MERKRSREGDGEALSPSKKAKPSDGAEISHESGCHEYTRDPNSTRHVGSTSSDSFLDDPSPARLFQGNDVLLSSQHPDESLPILLMTQPQRGELIVHLLPNQGQGEQGQQTDSPSSFSSTSPIKQIPMFQSASGKPVSVSKASLETAANLFQESSLSPTGDLLNFSPLTLGNHSTTVFNFVPPVGNTQAGPGSTPKPLLSASPLQMDSASHPAFDDIPATFFDDDLDVAEPTQPPPSITSVSSASPSQPAIIDRPSAKPSNATNTAPISPPKASHDDGNITNSPPVIQFASGKTYTSVQPPSSRIAHLFDDLDEDEPGVSTSPAEELIQFASGKPVIISEAAKARAARVYFSDDDNNEEESKPAVDDDFPLIQMASGRSVHVSAASKSRAASLFAEISDDDGGNSDNNKGANNTEELSLFTTGSGKVQPIPTKINARVANLFQDIDNEFIDYGKEGSGDNFPMISFASGRTPIVSEASKKRAAQFMSILSQDETERKAPLSPSGPLLPLRNQQTPGGVSEEDEDAEFERMMAAARAKRLAEGPNKPSAFTPPTRLSKQPTHVPNANSAPITTPTRSSPPNAKTSAFKPPQKKPPPIPKRVGSSEDSEQSPFDLDPLDALADEILLSQDSSSQQGTELITNMAPDLPRSEQQPISPPTSRLPEAMGEGELLTPPPNTASGAPAPIPSASHNFEDLFDGIDMDDAFGPSQATEASFSQSNKKFNYSAKKSGIVTSPLISPKPLASMSTDAPQEGDSPILTSPLKQKRSAAYGPSFKTPTLRAPAVTSTSIRRDVTAMSPARSQSPNVTSPLSRRMSPRTPTSTSPSPSASRVAPELSKQLFQSPFKNSGAETPGTPSTRRQKTVQYKDTSSKASTRPAAMFSLVPPPNRITLKQFALERNRRPGSYDEASLLAYDMSLEVIRMTSDSAKTYEFKILDRTNGNTFRSIGVREVKQLLINDGADPKLIPADWVENHFRWIVWKLACTERAFPQEFATKWLTPERVLAQLKYRYEREINRAHRSALHKILEQDESAGRHMVLCVAAIRVLNDPSRPNSDQWFEDYQSVLASAGPNAIVEVTDGWYSINAILDDYLTKHLHAGKIVCGTKLHVFGAEIVGSEQAKSPLDVTATTMMRLRLNGTKRSQWYTQLGFQKQGAFIIPLRALRANGGDVAKVDVFIQRVYPLTFSEKYMDTKTVRNTRGEEVASDRFNERRRTFIEQLAAKLTDEREKEKAVVRMQKQKQGGYSNYLAKVISGDIETEELYDIACSGSDLSEFMKLLTPTLQQRLADYAQRVAQEESDEINSTIRKTLEETPEWNREVTPILKMLVCDYTSSELTPASQVSKCLISIMRPSEYLLDVLKEGARISIFQLNTTTWFPPKNQDDSPAQKAAPVNVFDLDKQARLRDGTLSLRAIDKTAYIPYERAHVPCIYSIPRRALTFDQIGDIPLTKTEPGTDLKWPKSGPNGPRDGRYVFADEFDGVGVVVAASSREVTTGRAGAQLLRQNIFVADHTQNIIAVHIIMHADSFPSVDFFQAGRVLAFSNLNYRFFDQKIAMHICEGSEMTEFTGRPTQPHLAGPFTALVSWVNSNQDVIAQLQIVVDDLLSVDNPNLLITTTMNPDGVLWG